jgi:hypothetical protein
MAHALTSARLRASTALRAVRKNRFASPASAQTSTPSRRRVRPCRRCA